MGNGVRVLSLSVGACRGHVLGRVKAIEHISSVLSLMLLMAGENRLYQYVTVSSCFVPGGLDLLEGSGGNSHAELQRD